VQDQRAAITPAAQTPRKRPRQATKFASVIALLEREAAATIGDLQDATGGRSIRCAASSPAP